MRLRAVSAVASIAKARVRVEGRGRGGGRGGERDKRHTQAQKKDTRFWVEVVGFIV